MPAWSLSLQLAAGSSCQIYGLKSCRALNKFRASFQNMKNVELKYNS